MRLNMNYLCFDIGGTYIKYAMFNAFGEQLTATEKVKTRIEEQTNHILEQILEIIKGVQLNETLAGIAIATAGVVDSSTGSLRYAGYTIPNYTGTPLKEKVEELTKVPCVVINDVNAACLGEFWQGFPEGKQPNSLICLTIGTGVGGAVMFNKQLYYGMTDMAGEIGYLPINGQHFQDLASTTALLKAATEVVGYEITGEEFFELLSRADSSEIQQVFANFIDALATGILSIQYLLNPECIVLGGGILAQEAIILPALQLALKAKVVDERFLTAQIKSATLGNNAGMLGALYLLLNAR